MLRTPEDAVELVHRLHAELSKPETMERLFRTVLPHLVQGEKTLVYILSQIDRIGHLAMELLFLKTLFGAAYKRIVVITGPLEQAGVNPYVLRCPGPEFVHVPTADPILPLLGFLDGGVHDLKLFDLCLVSPQRLVRDYGRHVVAGGTIRHFALPAEIAARGEAFLAGRGMPDGTPFVLLHVRDTGYLPEKSHHAFRCADIANYGPAIDRFLDAGYWVFRLGDAGSPRLAHASERVVDVPHLPDYDMALDIFLAARCAFAFNQASGPEALVRAFGRPAATVNLAFEHLRMPLANDLLLFKSYVSIKENKYLIYREILSLKLPAIGTSERFAELGVRLEENNPEELAAAAEEMLGAVSAGPSPEPDFVARFRALGRAYEADAVADAEMRADNLDFYAYAHPFGRPAAAMLMRNPAFLD